MADLLVFLLALIISIRTFSYGFRTFCEKNIIGGIFVTFLSFSVLALAVYLLFFNRT